MEQNYDIWELLQPEEENYEDDNNELLPGLKNARWITVEQNDAGEEDETVLFRTFVDAAIGGKTKRIWSQGSPYMLLLSIKEGESEPQVTGTFSDYKKRESPICNLTSSQSVIRAAL